MADTTVTVRTDGTGDYTTITAAVAASDVSSGYYKIEIDDSSVYSAAVNLSPATGTPTSSNYMWLTVSDGNRHAGVAGTGHASVNVAGTQALQLSSDYARVEYLEIETGSFNCIFVTADNVLISRCILHDSPYRGFYTAASTSFSVDNSLIYGNARGLWSFTGNSITRTGNFDYCTIVDNAGVNNTETNVYLQANGSSGYQTLNFYNVALGGGYAQDIVVGGSYTANVTHGGSNNAWDTDTSQFGSSTYSYTSSQDISSGGVTTTTTTANAMIVTDLTPGSENYTPVSATGAGSNLLLGNGSNRQGSEPDSRQDFSTDIRGKARPTTAGKIDIGAFQITTAAGFKYWDGSAWADSTAVQYWNGSAWTDVTGIQYWNGSAWTDPS
jgi:hypothetical protein